MELRKSHAEVQKDKPLWCAVLMRGVRGMVINMLLLYTIPVKTFF